MVMFASNKELFDFVQLHAHAETREIEFKRGESWETLKLKIVKEALGLANLKDGGRIIIGVEQNNSTKIYELRGMSKPDSDTFDQDIVSEYVNEFADPHIDLELKQFNDDSKYFIVIRVLQFEDQPIICKKGSADTIRGRIYFRSHKKIESTPDPLPSDMRKLLELAIDQGIIKQKRRILSYELNDINRFEKEKEDF